MPGGRIEPRMEARLDAFGWLMLDALRRDGKQAVRRLAKDWQFSIGAILILALGIGANTAFGSAPKSRCHTVHPSTATGSALRSSAAANHRPSEGRSPTTSSLVLGGWQLNGIVIRQAGPPLAFGNVLFVGDINDIALPQGQRSVDRWFNTAAGFNRVAAQQLQFNVRTFPLFLSGVRGDGRSSWDLSAIKNFRIQEKIAIQFRAECYNAWNHANFSTPVTDPVNTAFGQVTSTASDARSWQFSLSVKF
jgi:hypothetical protein